MSNIVKWTSRALDWMSRPSAATVQTLGHPAAGVLGWIGGNASASGIAVTEENAYDYSPVFACTRILATSGGDLPCRLMLGDQNRKVGSGGKKVASQHPVHWLIHQAPNSLMSCSAFFRQGIVQQVNSGNSFSEIERDGSGRPIALWPIHSSRVQVKRSGNELTYLVHLDGGRAVLLAKEDVLHVACAPSLDGISGMGIIAHARETIGAGMQAERHAGYTFANGAVPRTVLSHPRNMSKDARANLREEWQQLYGGTNNAGKTAVLWEGMTLTALSVNNADAQFLETRKFNATEVARWYGVPPHMIGDLERATFSNIEHQGRSFVQTTLRPLINPWQDELDRKLLTEDERRQGYYVYFDYDEWQRGDMQSRAMSNQINFMNGFINQDEVRASEDRDPLPNGLGQKFYAPANLVEVGKEPEPEPVVDDAEDPEMPLSEGAAKPVEGRAKAYSDDQPRDEGGRFGEGGGGGGDSEDGNSDESTDKKSDSEVRESRKQEDKAIRQRQSTEKKEVKRQGREYDKAYKKEYSRTEREADRHYEQGIKDFVRENGREPDEAEDKAINEAVNQKMGGEPEDVAHERAEKAGAAASGLTLSQEQNDSGMTPPEYAMEKLEERHSEERRQIEDKRAEEDASRKRERKSSGAKASSAAQSCFSDAFSRMVRVEQNAARSAAKKSGKWFPWLDEFYGRHEQAMVAALEHPGNVLIALGQPCDVPAICKAHCKESYDLLLAASDAKPDKFEAAVDALVAGWAERANIHKEVAHV